MSNKGSTYGNCYWVMRHGQSEANKQGIIVSEPEIGIHRFGLTKQGCKQVDDSARSCQINPTKLRIYCSDFLRARQTAEIVHETLALQIPLVVSALLRERYFGELDGKSDRAYDEVWAQDVLDSEQTANGIESANAVAARGVQLLRSLEAAYVNETFLLVAHGDVLQLLQTQLECRPASQHRQLRPLAVAEIRRLV